MKILAFRIFLPKYGESNIGTSMIHSPVACSEEPRGCLEFAEESASFVLLWVRSSSINQGVWPDVSAYPILYLKMRLFRGGDIIHTMFLDKRVKELIFVFVFKKKKNHNFPIGIFCFHLLSEGKF